MSNSVMRRGVKVLRQAVQRWRHDLQELVSDSARRWDRDFQGEVSKTDIHHAVFIVLLSLIPASLVAYTSSDVSWRVAAHFFGAPMQAVIAGFLTSTLIFLGAHANRVPKPFSVAFKLMLRIMAINPLLGFLSFSKYGPVIALLIHGGFVIRAVRKTYAITLRNALLFWGMIYVMFSLMQLQSVVAPPPTSVERLKSYTSQYEAPRGLPLRG